MSARLNNPTPIASDYQNRKARTDLNQFPGSYGLPILGHTLKLVNNPRQMEKAFYRKYGEVYRAGIAFRNTLTVHGPDAAAKIFLDPDKAFSSGLGQPELNRVFPGFLLLRDFDEHKFHRKLLQPLFKKENMQSYIREMNDYMLEYDKVWQTDTQFAFYPRAKEMALGIAASVFMGLKEVKEITAFNDAFTDLADSLLALVRLPIPGNRAWKGKRGKKYLYQQIKQYIENKGDDPQAKDMLSHMSNIRDESGEPIGIDDIMGHLVGFMFAAHDTTTSTLCALFYMLGREPQWQETLREEILALNKDALEFDDFAQLIEMDKVFKETLRLFPPASQTFRRTIKAVDINGQTIPADTYVKISMDFIHQMPELWQQPERFDPERFAPPREEHKNHQFAFLPFGGGAHKCIGMHFSDYEVKTVLFHLLKNYRVVIEPGYETQFDFLPVPRPKDNLPLTLVRL